MKALIYKEPYRMELEEIPAPAVNRGEVLVRVKSVGACGSDIHGFSGKTGRRYSGMVMGHEISGEVVELGKETKGLKPGQKVVIQPIIFCGSCEMCKEGKTSVCLNKKMVGVNMGTVGGLCELISIPADRAFPIDNRVAFPVAAMVEPFAVGEGAASNASLTGGETVAIVGSGTIGLTILLMVKQRNPSKIFIIDQSARKLEIARKFGAVPINFKDTDPVKFIMEETGGRGVDVGIEAVGMTPSVRTTMAVTKTGGRAVWIGNSEKIVEVDMQDVVVKAKSIVGVYSYTDENFGNAVSYIEKNIDTASLFAEEEVGMEEARQFYTELADGEKELLRGVVNLS